MSTGDMRKRLLDPSCWGITEEESIGLYPGLVVWDHRVSGSITLGSSRLPIWCFAWVDFPNWDEYGPDPHESGGAHYGVTQDDIRGFIHNLFELRGEFARLLLVLAEGERWEDARAERLHKYDRAWYQDKKHHQRAVDQLKNCLRALGEEV